MPRRSGVRTGLAALARPHARQGVNRPPVAPVRAPPYTCSMTMKINQLPSNEQIDAAANERIERRRNTGRALVGIASQLQQAQQDVEKFAGLYAEAFVEATTEAWTVKELAAQGLPSPDQPVRRRRQKRTTSNGTEDNAVSS